MADPDRQIRGGGGGGQLDPAIRGGAGLKKIFFASRASVWSRNKGGSGSPCPSPGSTTAMTLKYTLPQRLVICTAVV